MSDVTGGKVVEADVRSFEGRQVASVVSGSSHEREKEGGGGGKQLSTIAAVVPCCRRGRWQRSLRCSRRSWLVTAMMLASSLSNLAGTSYERPAKRTNNKGRGRKICVYAHRLWIGSRKRAAFGLQSIA